MRQYLSTLNDSKLAHLIESTQDYKLKKVATEELNRRKAVEKTRKPVVESPKTELETQAEENRKKRATKRKTQD